MCTLTYIPTSETGFILTSNRDELHTRPTAAPPEWHDYKGRSLFFSRDPEAGGTWLGHHRNGRILCLLNGAFQLHEHRPPYRMSRGLVVLEGLVAESRQHFVSHFDFAGIEPFTLVWLEGGERPTMQELRWDEKRLYVSEVDTETSHIWSSATLYNAEVRQKREQWFADWLAGQDDTSAQRHALDFHRNAGKKGASEEAVCMRHEKGGTVSITSLEKRNERLHYFHHNLRNDKKTIKGWSLVE